MNSVAVKRIEIKDVGPFSKLNLSFRDEPGLTILCGENGIGKTSILNIIAGAFVLGESSLIKRRVGAQSGSLHIEINEENDYKEAFITVENFDMSGGFLSYSKINNRRDSVIYITTKRDFSYSRLSTISNDPPNYSIEVSKSLNFGMDASSIKQWFSSRFLLSPHAQTSGWTDSMRENFDTAKELFSLLDRRVKLDVVNSRTFDIEVSTLSGTVPFELLSSGFRTIYSLFLGVIKELEYRNLDVSTKQFSGIILIDELELHLHPLWQKQVALSLKHAFPKAQIICSTHSPHIVQSVSNNEVMSLATLDTGTVYRRDIPVSEYGFEGWTIEEILEDVMGMPDTRSDAFRRKIAEFDRAVDEGNRADIERTSSVLLKMLHPRSPLRKLIQIENAVSGGE